MGPISHRIRSVLGLEPGDKKECEEGRNGPLENAWISSSGGGNVRSHLEGINMGGAPHNRPGQSGT